jgi:EPS-associated MarR family transcriptional regulator
MDSFISSDTASRQTKIQEDTNFRIMRLLQENPELSQRDLADKLGMSLGGLNYCLKALIDKGFVKLDNFQNSKHKLKYVYALTPAGISQKVAMTGRFLKRKMEEYEALKEEIKELKAEMSTEAFEQSRKITRRK